MHYISGATALGRPVHHVAKLTALTVLSCRWQLCVMAVDAPQQRLPGGFRGRLWPLCCCCPPEDQLQVHKAPGDVHLGPVCGAAGVQGELTSCLKQQHAIAAWPLGSTHLLQCVTGSPCGACCALVVQQQAVAALRGVQPVVHMLAPAPAHQILNSCSLVNCLLSACRSFKM